MFILDIFKRDARRLQVLSAAMAAGLFLLLAGLWYVQIVSSGKLERDMVKESYRTNSVPAPRGRILDRDGRILADNSPHYNVVLYLEDLRSEFAGEYTRYTNQLREDYLRAHPGAVKLPFSVRYPGHRAPDCIVVSNISYQAGAKIGQAVQFDPAKFLRFYTNYPYVPFQILTNLDRRQVAVFSEQLSGEPGLELVAQPVRSYPYKTTAAHLIGYVQRFGDNNRYLPPEYAGRTGLEAAFDDKLSGEPGADSVLVNSLGYRQSEEVETPARPGEDIYLTIALPIQQAAEKALARWGANTRGAAVVMDVRTGDILAMASAPAFDLNEMVNGVSPEELTRLSDPRLKPLVNRATYDAYPPGSTFKIITAIAGLETGVLDPNEIYRSLPNPQDPKHGKFMEQGYGIDDTAPPDDYDFEKAFYHSSNSYFCHYGLRIGLRKLLEVAKRFHLGEKTGISAREEVAGNVPPPDKAGTAAAPLNSAPEVSIGQEVQVTPIQMVAMIAAIANGGTLFWPRVVMAARPPGTQTIEEIFPQARVRDEVRLDPKHLQIIRHAMLQDTEHTGANAYPAFHHSGTGALLLSDFHVAGKTGTAQVDSRDLDYKRVTWFDSFGPYENPRYAVVVMVVAGASGGDTCAPSAEEIYEAIAKWEKTSPSKAAVPPGI